MTPDTSTPPSGRMVAVSVPERRGMSCAVTDPLPPIWSAPSSVWATVTVIEPESLPSSAE
jgi:hypothetical protein